jgi:hypothetical protein
MCQTIHVRLGGVLKLCDRPWSEVSMCALIQLKDGLNNVYELWRDEQ